MWSCGWASGEAPTGPASLLPKKRPPLWAKANALYAGYDGYQTLAGDREIPVVICSPRD